jgi:hypothetical protein
MSDVKPSWQLEIAKYMIPVVSYQYYGSPGRDDTWSTAHVELEISEFVFDMEGVAAKFNPKWVHQIARSTSADQQGLGVIGSDH